MVVKVCNSAYVTKYCYYPEADRNSTGWMNNVYSKRLTQVGQVRELEKGATEWSSQSREFRRKSIMHV